MSSPLVQLGAKKSTNAANSPGGDAALIPGVNGPAVYIETYGCQMNVADSDLLLGLLGDQGYVSVDSPANADVILLNTCAVREKAEERVYARVAELSSHKKKRDVVLGVVGCMAEHLRESLLERAPSIDVIGGPDSYRRIPELLARSKAAQTDAVAIGPLIDVKLDKDETYEGLAVGQAGDGVSAFVTIQRGCDRFCTFCVVPFTRGRERGAAPREILRQVRQLAEAGHKEVVLLGQTVNSYRYEDVTFAELLRAVATVEGIERIRFTSPYPMDFDDDVIAVLASEPKVCGYVHLPVQSGSNPVLERMRRGYTREDYLNLVSKLREKVPTITLSTDILSGFSGETEEDHEATLSLMREVGFDFAFMFSYSERGPTYAAKKLPDDVPEEIKKRRLSEIVALQESISREKNLAHVGSVQTVLFHTPSKRDPNQLMGRTDGFKAVICDAEGKQPGDFAQVQINRSTLATLFGEIVQPA